MNCCKSSRPFALLYHSAGSPLTFLSKSLLVSWIMMTLWLKIGQMLGCAYFKSWICAWVVDELVSPGHWDHSSQLRDERANSPRNRVRDRVSFPKCRGIALLLGGGTRYRGPLSQGWEVQGQLFSGVGTSRSGPVHGEVSSARLWYFNIRFKKWFNTWFTRALLVTQAKDIHKLEVFC